MELVVEDTRHTIPEKWVCRWQFLVDYRYFITHSDHRGVPTAHNRECTVTVPWTYTGAGEVALWIELNKKMDGVRIAKPAVYWNKMLNPDNVSSPVECMQESHGQLNVSITDWLISFKAVKRIVGFMNPTVYSYLLCVDIDDGNAEHYHWLGYYASLSSVLITQRVTEGNKAASIYSIDRLSSAIGVVLRCRLTEMLQYSGIGMLEVIESIARIVKRTRILDLIGIIRCHYSRKLSGSKSNNIFITDLRTHLEDDKSLPSIKTAMEELNELRIALRQDDMLDTGMETYIKRVMCLLLYFQDVYSNSIQLFLLCGLPMRRQLNDGNGLTTGAIPRTIYSALIVDNLVPFTRNRERLLDMIQTQLTVCPPSQLASIAKYLLGLGPAIEGWGKYVNMGTAPAYYDILFDNIKIIGKKTNYYNICQELLWKYGEKYMKMCIDCLLRLVEYHKSTTEKTVGDLFTTYSPDSLPDLNSPSATLDEDTRLIKFAEVAVYMLP